VRKGKKKEMMTYHSGKRDPE
jgi:hypothetical protein